MSTILFSEEPALEKIGSIFITNINSKLRQFTSDVDAVFIKSDRFFSRFLNKNGFIIVPEWINLVLDVSNPLADIMNRFNKSAKEDIRKIKKFNYSYEIFTDRDKKEFFYNKMFVPYISKIDKTSTVSKLYFQYMKYLLNRCRLLLVKDKNKYISGGLIRIKKNITQLPCMGILDGDIEYVKRGAISSLLYYHILWAKENNIELLDFGHTRSFLNDGVLRYKRKWGMKIRESKREFGVLV